MFVNSGGFERGLCISLGLVGVCEFRRVGFLVVNSGGLVGVCELVFVNSRGLLHVLLG